MKGGVIMNRSLDKKKFESVIKVVYLFLRISVVALYVLLGILVVTSIVFPFIPKELFDFELANLEQIDIQVGSILYELRGIITFTGVVNVKWLLSLVFVVLSVNLLFFQFILIQLNYLNF